jgi:hypothetical protein
VPGDFDEDGHLDLLGCGATGTPATTSLTFLRNISAGVVAVSPPVRTVSFAITRLAPNPSRGAVALELAAPARGEARLSVVSLAGRVLSERTVALTPGPNRVALENGLKAGVYWVRAEGFGKATAQKFVVLP